VLSQRQQKILYAIVEDYVRSAEPVGSRTLSKHQEIQFSAATIRNEMADLEELGYLDQPHTSAGRVPSQKGYRFYVDHLMAQAPVDTTMADSVRVLFEHKITEVERLVQQTAQVLSNLTHQTAIVLGPRTSEEKVRQIEVIPIASGRAVAILVTETGLVQDRAIQLPEGVQGEDIAQLVRLLNDRLVGVPISKLRSRLHLEVASELSSLVETYEETLQFLSEVGVASPTQHRAYVGGASNILAQPEFRDVDKVRPLFELFEHTESIGRVLPIVHQGTIGVLIGDENRELSLHDCAVIGAEYYSHGEAVGRIGVIGPTRMDYARIVHILNYASAALSKVLTDRSDIG